MANYYSTQTGDELSSALNILNNTWIIANITDADNSTTVTASCGTTTLTQTASTSGTCTFSLPMLGLWKFTGNVSSTSVTRAVMVDAMRIYSIALYDADIQYVGGRIFHDAGDNGVTYTFYDKDMVVITDQTIQGGLANAYYYEADGISTTDRWYVFDNTSNTTTTLANKAACGWYNHDCIYRYTSGRQNTELTLAYKDPSLTTTPNIWQAVVQARDANLNGCNDWFIPSESEQSWLRYTNLVSWYKNYNIHSGEDGDDSETAKTCSVWNITSLAWVKMNRKESIHYWLCRSF